jgi:DNA replication ATP-dependent helicase Dna2
LINFFTADTVVSGPNDSSERALKLKERLPCLRDLIIRYQPPRFQTSLSPPLFDCEDLKIPGCDLKELSNEFSSLNHAQQKAVQKALCAQDYALIQGMPGTGKSSTITLLGRLLVARGKRVLITSYTHSAVDNIMIKLMEKGMADREPNSGKSLLVRIEQRRQSCHETVKQILCSELAREYERTVESPSAESLKKVVSGARIVGVSALSLPRSSLLKHEDFDVVIVDEAGQMNQPVTLGALMSASTFILVGDHKQLPPLVNSEIAESGGYGISMLKRLADKHPDAVAPLTMQYRMNEDICKVSSEATYGGVLKCANDNVKLQRLQLPAYPNMLPIHTAGTFSWLKMVIDPSRPVVFVDTDNVRIDVNVGDKGGQSSTHRNDFDPLESKIGGRAGGSIVNKTEALLIRYILEGLVSCGLDMKCVGVVSPYRAQIRIMEECSRMSSLKKQGLEFSTIDKYQGRDKSVIILSFVRSNEKGNAGRLLQDARRLNVALTRAKCKMIAVGSFKTLSCGSVPLKPILNRMDKRNQRIIFPETALRCYETQ